MSPLTSRRPPLIALPPPAVDGPSWPRREEVGRESFAEAALYRMGYAEAFREHSHVITDLVLDLLLPLLAGDAAPEDEPHLRRVFTSAVQVGAGIGQLERSSADYDDSHTDRHVAGALLEAADDLPPMPADQLWIARTLMHCGYYLARTEPARVSMLVTAFGGDGVGASP